MNCLSGLVGLKGCGNATPGSGLFVNSLPGVPMELLDKIANADQRTYSGVWTDTEIIAQEQLLTDFTILMGEKFQLSNIARSFQLPTVTNGSVTPQGAFDNGFTLNLGAYHPISRLMKQEVDRIGIYVDTVPADPFDIKISDYDTSEELWTLQVNTVAAPLVEGWNYVDVLQSFWRGHLKFHYLASALESAQITIPSSLNQDFCSCYCSSHCPGKIRGISNNTFSDDVIYGLTATINFTCSFESFICANRKTFSRPYWYLLGHTVMVQALTTNRFGRFNLTEKEKSIEIRDDLFGDYSQAMKMIAAGTRLNDDDFCLECDAPIRKGFVHP